ncbi:uncharacterized protein LOC100377493 [Saccoglossus kowalevskii]|uniref:Uncharacterized protein LOC100377493 isoform X1 n=1 Tax=Saccoglossus kowalevskii TaxID=10224 RepID=A0ABM0MSJ8_SACKO|nr:PREDICTED: uncharacterized protein LOC100377493 isoform X1 [Saccoglossus kowalevskii]
MFISYHRHVTRIPSIMKKLAYLCTISLFLWSASEAILQDVLDKFKDDGYEPITNGLGCTYIYMANSLQFKKPAYNFTDNTKLQELQSQCESLDNSHWNGTLCVCNHGWYKNILTAQCDKCVPCCDSDVQTVIACVNQKLVKDVCSKVKPCDHEGPTPRRQFWDWKTKQPYLVIGGGVLVLTVIAIGGWKRHKIKRALCCTKYGVEVVDGDDNLLP